jgi:hypothetical protein
MGQFIFGVMRQVLFFCCFVIAVLTTGASTSFAQKFSLDFDTYDGRASEWTMDGIGGATVLRATIKATRVGNHERWAPFLRVEIKTAKESFGLLIHAPQRRPPFQFFAVQRGGAVKREDRFGGTLDLNKSADIELSWAAKEKLIVRVGDHTRELPLSDPILGVQVMSGTANFLVQNIEVR